MAKTVVTMEVKGFEHWHQVPKDMPVLGPESVTSPEPKLIEQQKILMTSVLFFTMLIWKFCKK